MSTTLAAEWHVDEPQLRVTEGDARAALRAVTGRPVVSARARLRFGPGRTCEAVARLLDRAIVQAENAGLDPQMLVVADGSARAAEDIIRVRRKAHGIADWIHSPTCRVRIVLRPAGLYATSGTDVPQPLDPAVPAASAASVPAEPAGERAIAVSTGGGYQPGGPPTSPTAAASSCVLSASPSSPGSSRRARLTPASRPARAAGHGRRPRAPAGLPGWSAAQAGPATAALLGPGSLGPLRRGPGRRTSPRA